MMNSSILDFIKQGSGATLGELHARTAGDVQYTATSLAALAQQNAISFHGPEHIVENLTPKNPELAPRLAELLASSEHAEQIRVLPSLCL